MLYDATKGQRLRFWHPETSIAMCRSFLDAMGVAGDPMWLVEYDVRCHGSMRDALARCDG